MTETKTGRNQRRSLGVAVSQLKLAEPVRLYLYGVGGVIVAGLVLAGWLTDEWSAYLMAALGVVLGVVPATEAARASVYSTAGHIRSLRQLRTAQDITEALGEAA
jgi:hypothetical protein